MSVALFALVTLATPPATTYSGTVGAFLRTPEVQAALPKACGTTKELRDVPIALRYRTDGTVDLPSLVAETLHAEWKEEGKRLILTPKESRARREQEAQLLAKSANEQLGRLPKTAFEGPNPSESAVAEVMGNLASAKANGWSTMPKLALNGATQALVQRLGGGFLSQLGGNRPLYLSTQPSGLADAIPAPGQAIMDAYFRVQTDRRVQNALSESMEHLEGWFGPAKIDPRATAKVVVFALDRSTTDVYVSSAAYSTEGEVVDRASVVVPIPRPESIEIAKEDWEDLEQQEFHWSPECQLLIGACSIGGSRPDLSTDDAVSLSRALQRDPLSQMAKDIVEAIPLTDTRPAVAVVPADSWLDLAGRTVGRPARGAETLRLLGRTYGPSVRSHRGCLIIGSNLADLAERERADRGRLSAFRLAAGHGELRELHAYLALEASTGRGSLNYARGLLQAFRLSGQSQMRVSGSRPANTWLGQMEGPMFMRLSSEVIPTTFPTDPARLLQSTCDSWLPFQDEVVTTAMSPLASRCALWNPATFANSSGVQLDLVTQRLYVAEDSSAYLDLARSPRELADYLRQNRDAGIFSSEVIRDLKVREALGEAVTLVWVSPTGKRVRVPIADWRRWNGEAKPLREFPDAERAVKEIG